MDILEPSSNKVSFEQQGSTADGQPDEGSIPLNPVREQQVPLPEASDRVATKPHSLNELPTISTLCSDCLRRFQHLCDELSACTVEKGSQYGFDRDLSLGLMHDARSRFKAWAMSIAALHPSHFQSSLDFRLKGAAEIRQRVVKILNDLEESLLAVSGVEPNETWRVDDISDSDEDDGGEEVRNGARTSELDELFSAIKLANASLLKLSIVIRNSPARDDYLKAATRYKLDPRWDIGHVTEKHGSAKRSSKWLIERLGKAITRRRQYLKYRKEHHGKLSKDWEETQKADEANENEEDGKPERTIALTKLTKATTYVEITLPPGKDGSEAGGSFGSQTSYEPTMVGEAATEMTRLTVPPHPAMAFEGVPFEFGEPFQCPYCYTEQTVKNKTAWKKHVFQDLKPYVCTFQECDLRMFRSRNEWFNHELQNHRREWVCQFCQQIPFASKIAFSKHLASQHSGSVNNSQLEVLVLQSEEPVDKVLPSACHLCDEWETSLLDSNQESKRSFLNEGKKTEPYGTLKHFRRHLGRHMEQLALFTLPLNEDEDMEDESSDDVDDHDSDHSENENIRPTKPKGETSEPDKHVLSGTDVDLSSEAVVINADKIDGPPPPPPPPPPPNNSGSPFPAASGAVPGPPPPPPGYYPYPRPPISSTRLADITPPKVLDEDSCRKKLTVYRVYTIRKAPVKDNSKDKATWARSEIMEERLAQDEISRRIRKLNEARKSPAEKKAAMAPFQQGQINKLIETLVTEETDPKYTWTLAQLDRRDRVLADGRRETLIIEVYVKRSPHPDINTVSLFQSMERMKAEQAAAYGQPPQPPPGPVSSGKYSKFPTPVAKGKEKQKKKIYHGSSDSDSDSWISSESSGWDSKTSATSEPSMSGTGKRRVRRRVKRYHLDPPSKSGKSDDVRPPPPHPPIPALDPVAAAYQAGKMDADVELSSRRLERERYPPRGINEPRAVVSYERPDPRNSDRDADSRYQGLFTPRYLDDLSSDRRPVPATSSDPLAVAYQAGKIDADAERFGLARERERERDRYPPSVPSEPRPIVSYSNDRPPPRLPHERYPDDRYMDDRRLFEREEYLERRRFEAEPSRYSEPQYMDESRRLARAEEYIRRPSEPAPSNPFTPAAPRRRYDPPDYSSGGW